MSASEQAPFLDVARGCAPPQTPCETVARHSTDTEAETPRHPAGLTEVRKPYYLPPKAAPWSWKPYDWKRAKRDRHAVHNASYRLSAALRRLRREAA